MDSEESDSVSGSKPPLSGDMNSLSQIIENMSLHVEKYGVTRIPVHHPAWARLVQISAWTDMVGKAYEHQTLEWQSRKEELA